MCSDFYLTLCWLGCLWSSPPQVLEMLAYFTFYSTSISERLWSLWPALHSVLLDWGIDYWENILVPLDNMISRDTARFLGSQNPDYLASVFQVSRAQY